MRFPCISCLDPLKDSERWTMVLSGKTWWPQASNTGIWCQPCMQASLLKRNFRNALKAKAKREK